MSKGIISKLACVKKTLNIYRLRSNKALDLTFTVLWSFPANVSFLIMPGAGQQKDP